MLKAHKVHAPKKKLLHVIAAIGAHYVIGARVTAHMHSHIQWAGSFNTPSFTRKFRTWVKKKKKKMQISYLFHEASSGASYVFILL